MHGTVNKVINFNLTEELPFTHFLGEHSGSCLRQAPHKLRWIYSACSHILKLLLESLYSTGQLGKNIHWGIWYLTLEVHATRKRLIWGNGVLCCVVSIHSVSSHHVGNAIPSHCCSRCRVRKSVCCLLAVTLNTTKQTETKENPRTPVTCGKSGRHQKLRASQRKTQL